MPLKKLNVGQVVYILSNKAQAVLPALVIKEHRTIHLDAEEVTWTVQYGPPGKQRVIESHKVDGELFGTLEEVRDVMNLRFQEFVQSLIENAASLQNKWYPKTPSARSQNSTTDRLDPEAMIQEIEGTSPPPSHPVQRPMPNPKRQRIFDREELKQALQADDDFDGEFEENEKMKLRPDGSIEME